MNERLPFLREKTAVLTTSPGCYIMKNKDKQIIYIGKAKNLRNRVISYFRESADHTPKVEKMVSLVYDYDFIVTDSEFEALVLECSLIKLHKPKYNILLKDDKGYSYIKISDEQYPRITSVHQRDNKGTFIGPYMSSFTTKQTVEEVNKVFMLPVCMRKFPQEIGKQRPCLNYFIKTCSGVCTGNISYEEYTQTITQALEYIKSGSNVSIERMTEAMNKAADNLDFELAAKLRDRITAIKNANEKQKVFDASIKDTDVISIEQNGEYAVASILMYRQGKLSDKVDIDIGEIEDLQNTYETILIQFYSGRNDIPKEILIDEEIDNVQMLEQFLREKSNHAIRIATPKRGASLRLTMLAKNNASEYLSLKVGRTGKEIQALAQLGKILGLEKPPLYIECYDISNLASESMVAGMVVFENGRPLKKAYRKFSIKTVAEQNDYACMQEIITRRFKRYEEGEDDSFSRMPDLILLDGGKGHVMAVEPLIREMGYDVPVYGLVKDNRHRTRAIASRGEEISVSSVHSAFMLLTRIQDEVHRYAITYQRKVHSKNTFSLELTKVKGIGEKKAVKLISTYKTMEALKNASVEELARTVGISVKTAEELYVVIHNQM